MKNSIKLSVILTLITTTSFIFASSHQPPAPTQEQQVAQINKQNIFNDTPLHQACYNNDKQKTQYLLGCGADTNIPNRLGHTPLDTACLQGHYDIVAILLNHTSQQTIDYEKPLKLACEHGHTEIVKLLITHRDTYYLHTPFISYKQKLTMMLPFYKHPPATTVQLLEQFIQDSKTLYEQALSIACLYNHMPLVTFLISHKAPITENVVIAACKGGTLDIVKSLIYNCAPITDKVFTEACKNGNKDVVELLIKHSYNIKQSQGLIAACAAGHLEIAKLLIIEQSVNIHDIDENKQTALHYACQQGHRDIITLLIEHGAQVNAGGYHNATPLHQAKDTATTKLLLRHGAQINPYDAYGSTPSDYAKRFYNKEGYKSLTTAENIEKHFNSTTASATIDLLQRFIACNIHTKHIIERFLLSNKTVQKTLLKHAFIHNKPLAQDLMKCLTDEEDIYQMYHELEQAHKKNKYFMNNLESCSAMVVDKYF